MTTTEQMNYQQIGKLVRGVMEARGLTKEDLAKEAGLSIAMVEKVMYGTGEAGINSMDRIAKALDITFSLNFPTDRNKP